jgi:hypothetical protein
MSKTRKDSVQDSAASAQAPKKSGHKVVTGVIVALVVLVVFVLLTAFVWPGWATHSSGTDATTSQTQQESTESQTPKIKAKSLPSDATELLKSMPDTVGAYARQDVSDSKTWKSASPLEEHTVTYSTGTSSSDITLVVAQWAKSDSAKTQYDSLVEKLDGEKLAAGNVKVSGKNTGSYEVHEADGNSGDNAKTAVAVWQNDTCVFQASGSTAAVKDFYQKFPL